MLRELKGQAALTKVRIAPTGFVGDERVGACADAVLPADARAVGEPASVRVLQVSGVHRCGALAFEVVPLIHYREKGNTYMRRVEELNVLIDESVNITIRLRSAIVRDSALIQRPCNAQGSRQASISAGNTATYMLSTWCPCLCCKSRSRTHCCTWRGIP